MQKFKTKLLYNEGLFCITRDLLNFKVTLQLAKIDMAG